MPAKPLTPEQREDAARLNAIFEKHKAEYGLTQAMLADDLGYSVQSAVSQYLKGKIPLNVEAAIKFADRFSCRVEDFSPSLQREIDRIATFVNPDTKKAVKAKVDKDSVAFSILDVKAACGNGYINTEYPEVIRTLVMPIGEAQRLIGSTNKSGNIQIIVATKDSMIPSIYPDDLLFVDISIKDYVGEAVYILLHGGELVCKRISLVGREITVSSDNAAYPSWSWREKPDETKIIGKVIRVLPIKFKKFGSV